MTATDTSRVALITDGQGWIVDRISRHFQKYIPRIDIFYLPTLNLARLHGLSEIYPLIHFNNWFINGYEDFISATKAKTIVSIRSFRFGENVLRARPSCFHVIHPDMLNIFPNSVFIPDGIDLDYFKPSRPLVVGMAFQKGYEQFKGLPLLKEAIKGLDVQLRTAVGIPFDEMKSFYESIDLYVCASESEGFAAPVAECLAMNIPVISTHTGIATYLPGATVVERTAEALRKAIMRHLTRTSVGHLSWPNIAYLVDRMYQDVLLNQNSNGGNALPPSPSSDSSMDRRLDFSTEYPETLGLDPTIVYRSSPSGDKYLTDLLSKLEINASDRVLDIGCGKGSAIHCMLDFPFQAIHGIDLSEKLTSIARHNCNVIGDKRVEIFTADAQSFSEYKNYNIFYLYNPFPMEIAALVFDLIAKQAPSNQETLVIYNNPTCHDAVVNSGFHKFAEFPDKWGNRIYVYSNRPDSTRLKNIKPAC